MNTDAQPAESSPAPTAPPTGTTTPTLDRLTTDERATWRKTGQLPDVKADSSPAEPDKAASTDATPPPASEPGTPKPKKNAESRIQELLAERAQLRAELESARRPAPPSDVKPAAAPSAPPVGTKFPAFDAWITAQPAEIQSDAQAYELYIDARASHVFHQQRESYERQQSEAAAQREANERLSTYRQHAETFIKDHGDYWQVIAPVTDHAPQTPTAEAMGDVIVRSPNPPQLLYHLGSNLEEFNRLLSLPPHAAAYELGQLAALFSAPATPVVKTLSTAPEPPPTIRSKPSTPVDDVDAAVKRGDFASYKLAMNRRSVAGR